jgi:hypothetical protein
VATPLVALIVSIDALPLAHVPGTVISAKSDVAPTHKDAVPAMLAGEGITVTVATAIQPDPSE